MRYAEQSQVVAFLGANNSDGAGTDGVRSDEEKVSIVIVVQAADKENWNLYKTITVANSDGSGF